MSKRPTSFKAPDVLEKLGRPNFPSGLRVLLVASAEQERQELNRLMAKLCYQVTSCGSSAEARLELACRHSFDILLAEAPLVSKDTKDGQLLLEAACGLPLVLISSPGTPTECVWQGIEVGAADVLERPLSLLKLQNIWQHVVRKVMDSQDASVVRSAGLCKEDDTCAQVEQSPHVSRCTLSSSMSAVTVARYPEEKSGIDHEVSYSGSQDGKAGSLDASMSNTSPENSHTVDSPSAGGSDATQADGKPAKRIRRSKESFGYATSSLMPQDNRQPLPSQLSLPTQLSSNETVVGMVHPSWAGAQRGNQQSFRGSIPHGCVWGTPLHPPPGWQGMFPNGSGPLLGAAAANCSIARCHSAPVNKTEDMFCTGLHNFDSLPDLDPALMVDLTDDLLLGDDFLDCGSSLLGGLGSEDAPANLPEPVLEKPPLGLQLKKSESLVNLINQHLSQCRAQQQPAVTVV